MFGPHFNYDMIRLARKGWPTLLRVVYLSILLIGLTVMYRSTGNLVSPSQFAERAQVYANTLVVLQDFLVLLFLPVYVASAIAQEKENRTLEIVFLSFLTDREIVLGKLGARLMHLGAIALASFPLLIFMHLWGNVELDFLIYHEINTFLLLVTGGAICIHISTLSAGVFQAITRSYAWLAALWLYRDIFRGSLTLVYREFRCRHNGQRLGYSVVFYEPGTTFPGSPFNNLDPAAANHCTHGQSTPGRSTPASKSFRRLFSGRQTGAYQAAPPPALRGQQYSSAGLSHKRLRPVLEGMSQGRNQLELALAGLELAFC